MKISSFEDLINQVNGKLGDFCKTFARTRKELKGALRSSNRTILFTYTSSEERDWAINEGGGTEVQYHIFQRDGEIGYGIGFNMQYVPFANEKSPVEWISLYCEAFIEYLDENGGMKASKFDGFSFLFGDIDTLRKPQEGKYVLFGKTVPFDNDELTDEDFNNIINDIKGILFDIYQDVYKRKNIKEQTILKQSVMIEKCTKLLKARHNIVLTGAPGTGKTFLAQLIAQNMGATMDNGQCVMVQFHPSYDYTDFVEGLRPKLEDEANVGFELRPGEFKRFCAEALSNFLDSTKDSQERRAQELSFKSAYEELINKIDGGEIKEIPLRNGTSVMDVIGLSNNNNIILKARTDSDRKYIISYNRLKKLSMTYKDISSLESISNIYNAVKGVIRGCHTSAYWAVLYYLYQNFSQERQVVNEETSLKNYVFIIDEINRGEISKIFGELFFSIDPGYRGSDVRVKTQYQNLVESGDVYEDGFFVPSNVYIIGTMNDIDRSVEAMDFAMRRRFAWVEIKATDRVEMLDDLGPLKEIAIRKMNRLNSVIEKTEGLNASYHIGPAYFRNVMDYRDKPDVMWINLWDYHISGLLYEYLRGSDSIDEKMKRFEDAYSIESQE